MRLIDGWHEAKLADISKGKWKPAGKFKDVLKNPGLSGIQQIPSDAVLVDESWPKPLISTPYVSPIPMMSLRELYQRQNEPDDEQPLFGCDCPQCMALKAAAKKRAEKIQIPKIPDLNLNFIKPEKELSKKKAGKK